MGLRELREKYGPPSLKTRQAFNRAIRAEIPGGAALLDALALAGQIRERSPENEEIYRKLTAAREAAGNVLARRYDLVSTRGDASRGDETE